MGFFLQCGQFKLVLALLIRAFINMNASKKGLLPKGSSNLKVSFMHQPIFNLDLRLFCVGLQLFYSILWHPLKNLQDVCTLHSWQFSHKCFLQLWVGLLASGSYYFIQERTSKKIWVYTLMLALKWPLLKLHICILQGKMPKCQISYVQTSSGNATHLNSFSMTILTVGKKLGFQKFPERAFQALQSYLIKAIAEK